MFMFFIIVGSLLAHLQALIKLHAVSRWRALLVQPLRALPVAADAAAASLPTPTSLKRGIWTRSSLDFAMSPPRISPRLTRTFIDSSLAPLCD